MYLYFLKGILFSDGLFQYKLSFVPHSSNWCVDWGLQKMIKSVGKLFIPNW